jgi:flavin reductase (DIM6/NTAB) family NADH-FMN oxidoreductase RutF
VDAPRIAACFANLECRVVDMRPVPLCGLFVLEAVHAWIERTRMVEHHPRLPHHRGRGAFVTDERVIRPRSKRR